MNSDIDPDLVHALQGFVDKGTDIETAKTNLQLAGYPAEEISVAAHLIHSAQTTALTTAQQPSSAETAAAIALSDASARDQEERLRDETILAGLVGSPLSSTNAKYESRFYDNLGISYLKLLGIGAISCLAAIIFKLPDPIFSIFEIMVILYVAYVFIARFWPNNPQR